MTETEYLLTCLAEECAEVAQRVSKALRFTLAEIQPGQDFTNADRITEELHDLYGVVEMLQELRILPTPPLQVTIDAINRKREKVLRFMDYSRQRGTLK